MSEAAPIEIGGHADEPHEEGFNDRLNWLRAGVLGANDGIVSVAGIDPDDLTSAWNAAWVSLLAMAVTHLVGQAVGTQI